MPTDNIPTTALPIHDLDVVRVDVRMSALEPGLRTLAEKLSQDLHVARAALATSRAVRNEYLEELNEIRHLLGAGPGVTALEAVKARREAQAETRSVAEAAVELLNEVRAALGVGEGELTTESAKRVVRERDEAKARVYALTTAHDEEKARRLEAEQELELARVEADARPNQSAWEAACRLRKERDEALAELTGLQDVNVAVRSIVGIGNGESLIAAVGRVVDRLRTLETAIKHASKVLP